MTAAGLSSCIYEGTVVHKRLAPRQHGFSYRVFALCLDVDEIDEVARRLRLFSRNHRNLLSFRDTDLRAAGRSAHGAEIVCRDLEDRAPRCTRVRGSLHGR